MVISVIAHFRVAVRLSINAVPGVHVNEKMGTKTRFEEDAKGNSEMAYSKL